MQIGEAQPVADEVRAVAEHFAQRREDDFRRGERLLDQSLVDRLVHPRTLTRRRGLKRRSRKGLVDIPRDGAGFVQIELAMPQRGNAPERMPDQVFGGHTGRPEDLRLLQGVRDRLLLEAEAGDPCVHAALEPVERYLVHFEWRGSDLAFEILHLAFVALRRPPGS